MKNIYIASPLSAKTVPKIKENMKRANEYAYIVKALTKTNTFAIHGIVPELLDDTKEWQRKLALKWGHDLLTRCDCLAICSGTISRGMKEEICLAEGLGIQIKELNRPCSRFHLINVIRLKAGYYKLTNYSTYASTVEAPCLQL